MARNERTVIGLNQPEDMLAGSLEARGFWRRAADRWLELMVNEPDEYRAEALAKRRVFCLHRALDTRPKEKIVVLSENDRRHLDARAKVLGCGPVSKYWIDYGS